MKIISFILIAVMGLYIIRTTISIVKTIKERKRAREPSIEFEGKEDVEDDYNSH